MTVEQFIDRHISYAAIRQQFNFFGLLMLGDSEYALSRAPVCQGPSGYLTLKSCSSVTANATKDNLASSKAASPRLPSLDGSC